MPKSKDFTAYVEALKKNKLNKHICPQNNYNFPNMFIQQQNQLLFCDLKIRKEIKLLQTDCVPYFIYA